MAVCSDRRKIPTVVTHLNYRSEQAPLWCWTSCSFIVVLSLSSKTESPRSLEARDEDASKNAFLYREAAKIALRHTCALVAHKEPHTEAIDVIPISYRRSAAAIVVFRTRGYAYRRCMNRQIALEEDMRNESFDMSP